MSRPTTRVLMLLELLQDRPGIGGRELAERLEVDTRTIRRYATRLQELGIPVEAERGRAGGYRLRPGYRMPPLMLTDDEATAVVLGLVAARRFGLVTAEPAVDGALQKIERVLPLALRERARAVIETTGFTRSTPAASPPATDTMLALAEAARLRRRVRVRYRSFHGEETERDLDPYGLVVHAGRWYLAAYDHRREEVRTFRVDRVLEVERRDGRAVPPEGFDAVEHVSRSLARVPWRQECEVLLDASIEDARLRISPAWGELVEVDGGVLLRAGTEDFEHMARALVGFCFPFRVLSPDGLRDAVRDLGAELLASADWSGPGEDRTAPDGRVRA
jgi:predicted DNA-binding transcriptional regulator YafY